MGTSPHIIYRNFRPTWTMDTYILDHFDDLERHVSPIVEWTVALEGSNLDEPRGPCHVRIDLTVPGAELVVDLDPHGEEVDESAYRAIDRAFDRAMYHASGRSRADVTRTESTPVRETLDAADGQACAMTAVITESAPRCDSLSLGSHNVS
jgi:hypothetical protein